MTTFVNGKSPLSMSVLVRVRLWQNSLFPSVLLWFKLFVLRRTQTMTGRPVRTLDISPLGKNHFLPLIMLIAITAVQNILFSTRRVWHPLSTASRRCQNVRVSLCASVAKIHSFSAFFCSLNSLSFIRGNLLKNRHPIMLLSLSFRTPIRNPNRMTQIHKSFLRALWFLKWATRTGGNKWTTEVSEPHICVACWWYREKILYQPQTHTDEHRQ